RTPTLTNIRAIVVGNPSRESVAGDASLPSLPFSEEEARRIAAIYPGSLLLMADRATKRAFLNELNAYEVVHYGGHAIVNDQAPALSRLLLAPDLEAGDGSLFVRELSRVRLNRTWLVVLAACSTGTGMISNGEGVQS